MSEKINGKESIDEVMAKMSEGNPGAMNVICNLVSNGSLMDVLYLDAMGIYGPDIWIAFKNCCHGDIKKLQERLKFNDLDLIKEIQSCKTTAYSQKSEG